MDNRNISNSNNKMNCCISNRELAIPPEMAGSMKRIGVTKTKTKEELDALLSLTLCDTSWPALMKSW